LWDDNNDDNDEGTDGEEAQHEGDGTDWDTTTCYLPNVVCLWLLSVVSKWSGNAVAWVVVDEQIRCVVVSENTMGCDGTRVLGEQNTVNAAGDGDNTTTTMGMHDAQVGEGVWFFH